MQLLTEHTDARLPVRRGLDEAALSDQANPSPAQRSFGPITPKLADVTDRVLVGEAWPGLWIQFVRAGRCSAQLSSPSKAGRRDCPHAVRWYSTFGGTC